MKKQSHSKYCKNWTKINENSPLIDRTSSVFNAFLANLPQMLDQNHVMGANILEAALHTLLYAPSTATVASANSESSHNIIYSYSLWRLEPHVRRSWLMSVEVIMYKVQCKGTYPHNLWIWLKCLLFSCFLFQYEYTQAAYGQKVHHLVRIILNSLEAQFHRCKRIPATVVMEMPARSRGEIEIHLLFIYLNKKPIISF